MSVFNFMKNIAAESRSILSNPRLVHKWPTLAHHLRMSVKNALIQRHLIDPPHTERIGSHKLRYADYGLLFGMWEEIFIRQVYAFHTKEPEPLILDVGSNIGLAVMFFKHIHPGAKIVAFEPDPQTFSILEQNIKINFLFNVTSVNKAVWLHDGMLKWHFDRDHPGSIAMSAIPRDQLPDVSEVPCVRLSEFVDREVDFLKLDVEGAELEVLADLAESGKLQYIRQLALEYHPWCRAPVENVVSTLIGSGFEVKSEPGVGPRIIRALRT